MERFSEEEIAECVRRHLRPLSGELAIQRIATGKFNTSYRVRCGGTDVVLRIAPRDDAVFVFYERRMMHQEPELHRLLREKTTIPVPEVRAFDTSRDVIDRDYLILGHLPGEPMTYRLGSSVAPALRQVGAALAQAHSLRARRCGYLGAHAPMEPQGRWVDAFRMMWRKLLDDVVAVGHYDHDEREVLLALLDRHLPLFDREVPFSLLHMDVWAENVLVDGDGNLTGLIDWDRALWGDPEIEFAVLDYCGISEPPFWEGYGVKREASPEAEVRRCFYLLYELQKYIVIRQGRHDDSAGALGYKEQVRRLAARVAGSV